MAGAPLALAIAVAAAVLVACDREKEAVVLDGRPRPADAEGVVTAVSANSLTLDGKRTYRFSRSLRSFSTYTMRSSPIRSRLGEYVHVGLDGSTAVWVAGVGSVVPGGRPVVFYNGTVTGVTERRASFRDGTVLRLAPEVSHRPRAGSRVRAVIDPSRRLVVALEPQ